jgi:tetratricopeptide (TPR) repeat protein
MQGVVGVFRPWRQGRFISVPATPVRQCVRVGGAAGAVVQLAVEPLRRWPYSLPASGIAARVSQSAYLPTNRRRRPPLTAVACLAVACALTSAGGCRLVPRRDPVPEELAAARRLCNQGLCAADEQDLARAETLLERAVNSCPTDIDARQHYADVLWKRGSKVEAVAQITKALELSPADVGLCLQGGRMYMDLGLLDDADRLSDDAVLNAPQSAEAWHLHGQVALARGRPADALADFHRALAVAPDDRKVLRDTAEIYRMLDRPQRALATLAILGETYGPNQVPAEVLALDRLQPVACPRRTGFSLSLARVGQASACRLPA